MRFGIIEAAGKAEIYLSRFKEGISSIQLKHVEEKQAVYAAAALLLACGDMKKDGFRLPRLNLGSFAAACSCKEAELNRVRRNVHKRMGKRERGERVGHQILSVQEQVCFLSVWHRLCTCVHVCDDVCKCEWHACMVELMDRWTNAYHVYGYKFIYAFLNNVEIETAKDF